jgi:hypothetical protein
VIAKKNSYFLKLFKVVDMDGSFPMKRYTKRLDSWFKSYEVFKISAQVGACCQPLSMQQNLPKNETLKYHQKLRF